MPILISVEKIVRTVVCRVAESFDLLGSWGGVVRRVALVGLLVFICWPPFTAAYDVRLFACVATQNSLFLPVVPSVRTWNVVEVEVGASCLLWKTEKIIDSEGYGSTFCSLLLCPVPSALPVSWLQLQGTTPLGLLALPCPAKLLSCSDLCLPRQLAEVWDVWEGLQPQGAALATGSTSLSPEELFRRIILRGILFGFPSEGFQAGVSPHAHSCDLPYAVFHWPLLLPSLFPPARSLPDVISVKIKVPCIQPMSHALFLEEPMSRGWGSQRW